MGKVTASLIELDVDCREAGVRRVFNRLPLTSGLLAILGAYYALRLLIQGVYASGIMTYLDVLAFGLSLIYVFGGLFLIDAFLSNYGLLILPLLLLFDTIVFSKPKPPRS